MADGRGRAAYSVTYYVGLALSTAVLRRRIGGLDGHRVMRTYVRLVVAAVPAAAAAGRGRRSAALGEGVGGSVASLAAGGLVMLPVYLCWPGCCTSRS